MSAEREREIQIQDFNILQFVILLWCDRAKLAMEPDASFVV
jgi:hypothetical protein